MKWLFIVASLLYQEPVPPVTPAEPVPQIVQKIKFPLVPTVTVDPKLITPVTPDAPFVLLMGRLFIVESNTSFLQIASSEGDLVSIKLLSGPRDFYGVFADGNGMDEERTYQSKYLAVVKMKGKPGKAELISIPEGAKTEGDLIRVWIQMGLAPIPPPDPIPVPKPDEPIPVPNSDLKNLIKTATAKYLTLPATDRPKLAAAFREAAVQIESGQIVTMQQLTKVTADLIVDKMGLDAFLPWVAWRDDVTKVLKTQNLTTPKDNLTAWRCIADVLEGK